MAKVRRVPKFSNVFMKYSLLLLSIVSFVLQSEVAQFVKEHLDFKQPYFMLYFAHRFLIPIICSFYALILPIQLLYSKYKFGDTWGLFIERLSLQTNQLAHIKRNETLNANQIELYLFFIAIMISIVFNLGAYLWYVAVSLIPMGELTAIYNCSCCFAYLLSLILLKEKVIARKCLAVVMCIFGISIISLQGSESVGKGSGSGYAIALCSSILVGLYEVLYKMYAVPKSKPSTTLSLHFTSLVGMATLIFGFLPIPLLHYSKVETFRLPNWIELCFLLVISLLGVGFNAVFMLLIAFAGFVHPKNSPVFAAFGILMTIPATAAVDYLFVNRSGLGWDFICGCAAIFVGFFFLNSDAGESSQQEESEALL